MKVILIKDIPRIGQRDTVKDVPEGYARNYLISKGLAIPATEVTIKNLENRINSKIKDKSDLAKDLENNFKLLSGKVIVSKQNSNKKGVLFKALHQKEISDILYNNNIYLNSKYIDLKKPIKQLGVYTILVQFNTTKADFILEIVN